jgi:hypothetical protein
MKTMTRNLMIAAAALAITAASVWAQPLKADIPFAFRAGSTVLAPGTYRVEVQGASSLVYLQNVDTRRTVALLPGTGGDVAKEWKAKGDPVLVFECGAGRCALIRMWSGPGYPSLSIPHGASGGDHAPLTLIRLVRASN